MRPDRRGRALLALFGAALLAGVSHAHMDTTTRAARAEMFVPDPGRARVFSLGFRSLVADVYWLRAVQLVGGASSELPKQGPLIADLVDVTTTVDPWVDHAYRFAAIWLTHGEDDVRAANHLLQRGISYHPLDWRNRYYLGFNHFFYLEQDAVAADVLETAIGLDGAPGYLGGLVARLRAGQGNLETAAAFLSELARRAQDPYAEAQYLKALDEIRTEGAARFLDQARVEFYERHGRDIDRVGELLLGPEPVLQALPPAHPHYDDFEWVLDPESDQIVSSFYGTRYRVHVHPLDAARRERWRREREPGGAGRGA